MTSAACGMPRLIPWGHMPVRIRTLQKIDQALNLLWRNNINPERVVMSVGFYGRSFTMKNPNCLDAGCVFTDGATGGECTGTLGVFSAADIN